MSRVQLLLDLLKERDDDLEVHPEHPMVRLVQVCQHIAEHGDGEDGQDTHGQLETRWARLDHQDTEERKCAQHLKENPTEMDTF